VAFVLLTGRLPFDRGEVMATLFAQVNDPVPRATELRPELPAAVNDVLARALAKASADRYATCIEFAEALRGALTPARPAPPPPNVPQRRKPHDALRQTNELRGLIDANRRVRADEPPPNGPTPPRDPTPPEDLSRLIDANRRLLAEKDFSGPYDEPAGHEPKGKHAAGKHAAGRPPEPEQTDPGAQQANGDAVLFSVAVPLQPPSSGSDGGPALPQNAADEAAKADEGGVVDMSGKTHPGQGTGPEDPNEQQKRWHRWTSFLPGMPRD
jgi:hypothetical protein